MKKGLIALFAATTFACAGSIFAAAPLIGAIPDVSIGDLEAPEVTQFTDSNFFVYTNAFNFDQVVSDADNNDVDLKWSFDEGDDPAPLTGASRWYSINGKQAMHCGSADMATDPLYAAHVTPGDSNDLRKESAGGSAWATFRDVVFSPAGGTLPFPAPTGNAKTAHEAGKLVYFAVSDGQQVTTKAITVRTVDNSHDTLSGGSPYDPYSDDKFDTQVSGDWTAMGSTKDINGGYDYTTGAYRVRMSTLAANKYTNVGWQGNRVKWILYNAIGSENYVRAKFYIYAQSEGTGWSVNDIPSFGMRVAYRSAFFVQQLVNPHDSGSYGGSTDIRPSTNPSAPSVYRVDFDPVDVPYLRTYSSGTNTEGICAVFEIQEAEVARHAYLCMSEQSFGTYPAATLTGTAVQSKTWNGTTNGTAGDMHNWDGVSYATMQLTPIAGAADNVCTNDPAAVAITRGESAAGITITGLATNTYIGSGEYTLFPGNTADGSAGYGQRIRVMENLIYKARYHLTSTQASGTQAEFWFGPRTLNTAYITRGVFSGGTSGNLANTQAIPGAQCLNPDKLGTETNGGWYTVIMNTPYSLDIRPDATGDIAARMPNIALMKAYGDDSTPGTGQNRRDIKLTLQMWDSIPLGAAESGQVIWDRATLEAYPQFDDSALP